MPTISKTIIDIISADYPNHECSNDIVVIYDINIYNIIF